MTLTEYRETLNSLPLATWPRDVFELLAAVAVAWANAEHGIPSEDESRRWSPVCEAAVRVVEQAAQG